jgi:Fe2+ transport system protein FeoA
MKLNELKKGQTAKITKVNPSCDCVLRVMTLGLVKGVKVTHVSSAGANMELRIYNSTVCISKHCAENIIVV